MNVFQNYYLFLYFHKKYYLILLYLYFLNFCLYNCNQNNNKNFAHIRPLPKNKFLLIEFNGIFIYQNDFSFNKKIYIFNENQKIDNDEDNKQTAFSELEYNNNFYAICLVKNFLYLFDNNNESIIKVVNLASNLTGSFYNLNLYNESNSLNCIISYIEKSSYESFNDIYILNFYKINFSINNEDNIITKNTFLNEEFVENEKKSYISDIYFSCQISYSSLLICFCLIEDSTKISAIRFNIKNNFEKESDIIFYYDERYSKLFSIKSVEPSEKNEILVYYHGFYLEESKNTYSFTYYKIKINKFKTDSLSDYFMYDIVEVYYFKNHEIYIFICLDIWNYFGIYKYDNNFNQICGNTFKVDQCDEINNYYLFYNDFREDYNIISDCYNNNEPSNYFLNISLFKEVCPNYIVNNDSNKDYLIQKIKQLEFTLNITKKDFLDIIPDIIDLIEIDEDYKITGEDFIAIIKPTDSKYYDNLTHINFQKCEDILRNHSNISSSRTLTILQMEINNINDQSLVNKVEYQIYDDNKNILNLSLCNNTDIQVFYLLKNNSYDLSSYSNFKDSNIDIFNINDSFFNDICQSYSDKNNDVILEDRIKYIYKNYSLCDPGCTYNDINLEKKTISCNCKVKTNLSIEEPILKFKTFNEIKIDSNFGLIKCYNLVFSFKGKLINLGFWIFLILVIIHIPLFIIIIYKGIKPIQKYIFNEMIKYGYMKKTKHINENKNIVNNNINLNSPIKKKKNINLLKDLQ